MCHRPFRPTLKWLVLFIWASCTKRSTAIPYRCKNAERKINEMEKKQHRFAWKWTNSNSIVVNNIVWYVYLMHVWACQSKLFNCFFENGRVRASKTPILLKKNHKQEQFYWALDYHSKWVPRSSTARWRNRWNGKKNYRFFSRTLELYRVCVSAWRTVCRTNRSNYGVQSRWKKRCVWAEVRFAKKNNICIAGDSHKSGTKFE